MNTRFYRYLLLATCAMLLAFSSSAMAQERGPVSEDFEGEGTAQNPYLIQSAADLRLLSDRAVSNNFNNQYFKLTADITINENLLNDEGELTSSNVERWNPIGNNNFPFRGVLDGNYHSISGICAVRYEESVGLFGYLNGVVKNLIIKDSYFAGQYVGSIAGEHASGGSYGQIYNCISYATVSGKAVYNYNFQYYDGYAGGICGYVSSQTSTPRDICIRRCAFMGKIKKGNCTIGGIAGDVGRKGCVISDCINTANVEGAGIANNCRYIYNCINKGNVSGSNCAAIAYLYSDESGPYDVINNVNYGKAGRFLALGYSRQWKTTLNVWNNYTLETTGTNMDIASGVDAVYGYIKTQNNVTKTAKQMKSQAFLDDLNLVAADLGADYCQWCFDKDGFVTLKWIEEWGKKTGGYNPDDFVASASLKGEGTMEDPYLISSVSDLRKLDDDVRSGMTFRDEYFKMTNDITLNHHLLTDEGFINGSEIEFRSWWNGIGTANTPFCGTFDGDGHAIIGLYINSIITKKDARSQGSANRAVFSYVAGEICNLTLKGSIVNGKESGGIVGTLTTYTGGYKGIVRNCRNESTVLEGGGIVGTMTDGGVMVIDCVNTGKCTFGIAGVCGKQAQITNCINYGDCYSSGICNTIQGGTISHCLNTGGCRYAGIVEDATSSTIKNCVNTGNCEMSATAYSLNKCNAYNNVNHGLAKKGFFSQCSNSCNVNNIVNAGKGESCALASSFFSNSKADKIYYLETAGEMASKYTTGSTISTEKRMTAKEMKQQSFLDELNKNAAALGNDYSRWKFGSNGFPTLEWVTDELLDGVGAIMNPSRTTASDSKEGVYNLSGQRLSSNAADVKSLPRGLYIVNGKKVVVR